MSNSTTDIRTLVQEFYFGKEGEGNILLHKKAHRDGSGDFACVRGLCEDCQDVVNCQDCFHTKDGSYCTRDGQSVVGFLAIEDKHQRLVQAQAPGAYSSIKQALAAVEGEAIPTLAGEYR